MKHMNVKIANNFQVSSQFPKLKQTKQNETKSKMQMHENLIAKVTGKRKCAETTTK